MISSFEQQLLYAVAIAAGFDGEKILFAVHREEHIAESALPERFHKFAPEPQG